MTDREERRGEEKKEEKRREVERNRRERTICTFIFILACFGWHWNILYSKTRRAHAHAHIQPHYSLVTGDEDVDGDVLWSRQAHTRPRRYKQKHNRNITET